MIIKDNNEYLSWTQFKETITEKREIEEALKRGEKVEIEGHTYESLKRMDE
jgi:hypothetical protein